MENKSMNPCKVITGPDTRWAYCNVWEPRRALKSGKMLYSIRLLIPKSDLSTIAKIEAAMKAAYMDDNGKIRGKDKEAPPLSHLQLPLRDGDRDYPADAEYQGMYYINCNTGHAPGIVDADMNPIISRSEVYSGVYGRASIVFYGFNAGAVRGIACGLVNLQKIRNGEPLGTHPSAAQDFA